MAISFSQTVRGQGVQLDAAGHPPGQVVEGDLRPLETPLALAALEQQEPVAHGEGVVRVVGDER
jgi:hypothetical protein